MEQHTIETDIVMHLLELLEKAGFQSIVPLYPTDSLDDERTLDTLLITVKSLNARYDRSEALAHIRYLMENIIFRLISLLTAVDMFDDALIVRGTAPEICGTDRLHPPA